MKEISRQVRINVFDSVELIGDLVGFAKQPNQETAVLRTEFSLTLFEIFDSRHINVKAATDLLP